MRTFAEFDSEFKKLKEASEWSKIIQIGLETLKNDKLFSQELATVHCRLASSYYYLGTTENYKKAQEHAEKGRIISTEAQRSKLLVRSLYLLSAASRALKDFASAIKHIELADVLYRTHEMNDNLLKGKLLFNWGAAYDDDPKNTNFELPREKYTLALEYYQSANARDDVFRVIIRLLNNSVKSKDIEFAQKMLKEIKPEMIKPDNRSAGHYYLALSRVNLLEGKVSEARAHAEMAVNIADKLQATTDLERAQTHLLSIPVPKIVGVAHNAADACSRTTVTSFTDSNGPPTSHAQNFKL